MRYLFLLLVLFASLSLFAQDAGRLWVVAIGHGRPTVNSPGLQGVENGARQLAQALCNARPHTRAEVLTSDISRESRLATKENVVGVITQLAGLVQPNDRVIIYYGGYGYQFEGQQYLVLGNPNFNNLDLAAQKCLSLSWLCEQICALRCVECMIWLDADIDDLHGIPNQGSKLPLTVTMPAKIRMPGNTTSIITFNGCRAGERVNFDKRTHYLFFTEALIEGLRGRILDARGQIDMSVLGGYVSEQVLARMKQQFPTDEQHPTLYTEQSAANTPARTIAIPAFQGEYGALIADTLLTRLLTSDEWTFVNRRTLELATTKLKLQETGIVDTATAIQLGKAVNAGYILLGTTGEGPGKRINLKTRLLCVDTGEIVPGVSVQCLINPTEKEGGKLNLEALAVSLLQRLRTAGLKD